MMEEKIGFTLNIAGCLIDVKTNYEICKRICEGYIDESGEKGQFLVELSREDILEEARRQNPSDGDTVPEYEHAYYESMALYRKLSEKLLDRDTLLMHGSAISVDGEAFLFMAPSGTGKSTHTALWREHFGDRAVMVNDDKPLIKFEKDQVLVCGTPWNGKHHLGNNICVPLKAIYYLERDEENRIEQLSSENAFAYVYQQTYHPQERLQMIKTLDLITTLLGRVPVYQMKMNNFREDAVTVAWEGMKEHL